MTRTEINFDMLKYALTTDTKIENKKRFMTAYKINSLIVGFLFFLFGFLVFVKVISERYMGLYFISIIVLRGIMRLFIQFKYTKKPSKERNI